MPISVFLRRTFLLLLATALPLSARAQFRDATPEELKMTADPKAPGAAAVYLNVEEDDDDTVHFQTFYARIKVLQEKGKELATVELPYLRGDFKVSAIKGRTIHADGTVIPLEGKTEDLLVFKNGDRQVGQKVFTLPSVEVGSILEYRYEIHYDDRHLSSPTWNIQKRYFVRQGHYSFKPVKGYLSGGRAIPDIVVLDAKGRAQNTLLWSSLLPPGGTLKPDTLGHILVDVADVPPTPDEEWMPPVQSLLYKVEFYYKDADSGEDFWVSESKQWGKDEDRYVEPTKALRDAAAGLVDAGDSELDKARKLYKAVQALDNTDFSRVKGAAELKKLGLHEARRAEDIWTQKSGSSEDIAQLYLALLRSAGLNAYAMRVVDRERRTFDPSYLHFGQFDDMLVILSAGGKEIFLDPGEKMCPFQMLHWRHAFAQGIRQGPSGITLSATAQQPYAGNSLLRNGEIRVDEHGAVTGAINFEMTGQLALRWRQTALRNDETEVKKRFDEWLKTTVPDGIEAGIDHFTALDNPDLPLAAMVQVKGALGAATAKRLLLPGYFFQTRGAHPFVDQEKRLEPVDMHYGEKINDQVVYRFPASFTVEAVPQDGKTPWEGHAVLVTKSKVDPGQVTIARQFVRAFTLLKAEEYQDLRAFYQKAATSDQQQLVLTATAAGKGN